MNEIECYYTPVKGSHSCRGCKYSSAPELFDGFCMLPPDIREQALKGIKSNRPFTVRTIPKEVTK